MPSADAELPTVIVHRPTIGPAEIQAVTAVCESGWFGMGEVTTAFEERLEEVTEAAHVVAVQSGTAALHLALEAAGVGPGDEVVVPSFTFAASVQAIRMAGGRPVFCEIDECTLTVDPDDVFNRMTATTRAILPVDYGGLACDYDALGAGARQQGVAIVADAAHSFGSSLGGRAVGTLADLTCFSFDASKNVTCGDGGAVATDDAALAERVRAARNLGISQDSWSRREAHRPWSYDVSGRGFRYRLGNLNAAIGLSQLERLEEFRDRKREIVRRYDDEFSGRDGLLLPERRLDETFPFLYPIRVLGGRRDALIQHLAARRVQAWVHFIPNHLQSAFAEFRVPLPTTERVFGEIASLPLHASLTDEEVERVVEAVRSFLETTVRA